MIDTIYFDNWNTLVQAPALMKRGSVTRILHEFLTHFEVEVDYETFENLYTPIAKELQLAADIKGFEEIDYWKGIKDAFFQLKLPKFDELSWKAWRYYLDKWPVETEFFPETKSILRDLKGKYKLGVITNYMDGPTCRRVFEKLGYDEIFDVLIVSADLGYRKPSRIIFDAALEGTRSKPESSIMVGDTYGADIVGANIMGMKSVLIDVYDSQQEYYENATVVIKNIGEFPQVLEKILALDR